MSAFRVKLGANDLNCIDLPFIKPHSLTPLTPLVIIICSHAILVSSSLDNHRTTCCRRGCLQTMRNVECWWPTVSGQQCATDMAVLLQRPILQLLLLLLLLPRSAHLSHHLRSPVGPATYRVCTRVYYWPPPATATAAAAAAECRTSSRNAGSYIIVATSLTDRWGVRLGKSVQLF